MSNGLGFLEWAVPSESRHQAIRHGGTALTKQMKRGAICHFNHTAPQVLVTSSWLIPSLCYSNSNNSSFPLWEARGSENFLRWGNKPSSSHLQRIAADLQISLLCGMQPVSQREWVCGAEQELWQQTATRHDSESIHAGHKKANAQYEFWGSNAHFIVWFLDFVSPHQIVVYCQ